MQFVSYDEADIPEESRLRVDPELERARHVALSILASGPRSRADLEKRLEQRGHEPDVVCELLDNFERVGLLNDADFASTVARTRFRERGRARRAIAEELNRKGLGQADIAEALQEITEDDERAAALSLARKKFAMDRRGDAAARQRRLIAYLARRGYSADIVMSCVAAVTSATEEG